MLIMLALLTGLLLLMTFVTLVRNAVWWIRDLDFPRLQLAFFALILLFVEIFYLDFQQTVPWILTAATVVCLVYQAVWILPYTPFFPLEVKRATVDDAD